MNLRCIRVATPRRMRAKVPSTVEVIQQVVLDHERGYIEGVPAMTIEAALRGAQGRVMTERLIDAARTAAARGLMSPGQEARVIADLVAT